MAPSSSSSEDEDMAKFIEAADNSVYTSYLMKDKRDGSESSQLPSLRNVEEEDDQHKHKGLHVTPAFQNHVAHHLTQLLDSQLFLDDNSKDSINTSNDSNDTSVRRIARAKRMFAPSRLSNTGEQVVTNLSTIKSCQNNSGVRLFGASAVFLSNLDIIPASTRRRPKRGRKVALLTSGSESSSEESDSSDSDNLKKCSAAAVAPDWVLSGTATKGWAHREGKVERCLVNESGVLVPLSDKNGLHSHVAANALNLNNNEKEVLSDSAKDDTFFFRSKKKNKKKKRRALSLDGDTLAASFNAAVCITSDSPCDKTSLNICKKKSQKKKRRKDHNSEDATTETTEVEDIGEGRKKKKKKRKKQKKKGNNDGMKADEAEVSGLLEEEEDEGIIVRLSPIRKKKKRNRKRGDTLHKIGKAVGFKHSSIKLKKLSRLAKCTNFSYEPDSPPDYV